MQTQPNHTQISKKTPLISFIITYYNEPVNMLKACIESILALSLNAEEREIIVIDDGSNLSPLDLLTDITNEIFYIRQPNQGLSQARNTGITMSSGQYLQFIDADDYLIPHNYEKCLDFIRFKNPDMVLFDETSKETTSLQLPKDEVISGTEYIRNNNLKASASGYIFKKNLLLNLRFTKGILHEDEEFTPQLIIRADKVYDTQIAAYFYRQRNDSITHKKDKRWKIKRLQDTEQIIKTLQDKADLMPPKERSAMNRRVAQLTMDYIYNTIILTHDEQYLNHVIQRLEKRGLYPLPAKNYTKKYKTFSILIKTKIGRKILINTLPLIKSGH